MTASLEGYAFLKIAGKGAGVGALRKEMLARFKSAKARRPGQGGKVEAVSQ